MTPAPLVHQASVVQRSRPALGVLVGVACCAVRVVASVGSERNRSLVACQIAIVFINVFCIGILDSWHILAYSWQ